MSSKGSGRADCAGTAYPNWMIERFPDVPVEKALWGG